MRRYVRCMAPLAFIITLTPALISQASVGVTGFVPPPPPPPPPLPAYALHVCCDFARSGGEGGGGGGTPIKK